ncbi:MAG: hypothetical protein AAB225_06105 [Acidobacteriota bacterium]
MASFMIASRAAPPPQRRRDGRGAARLPGMLQTTWCSMGPFAKSCFGNPGDFG